MPKQILTTPPIGVHKLGISISGLESLGGSQILNLFNHLLVDGFPGVPLINDFSKITAVVTFFADRALAAGTQKTTLRSLVEQH